MISYISYTSSPVQKQHSHGETISEPYKPAFHGGYLSCNMSHGGAATCYDSRLKVSSQETTLVLSNTRELDRVPSTE